MTETIWQQVRIAAIIQQTPAIKSFILAVPPDFHHRAGQHVDLRLTAPDGYQAMRSYSIASAPSSDGRVEIAIERLPEGEVSGFFHEVAEVGDDIELRGPLGGHFIWSPADGGPLLLIGGGSGVVPLMAMLRQNQAEASAVPIALLLSSRTLEETLYRDELLGIAAASPAFHLRLALTRQAPSRPEDYARRVDAAMVAAVIALLPAPPAAVFICGSNAFVNTAADAALAAGIAPGAIRTERYGG